MATTPGGLPYPTGSDFVTDGDNAIRALAEAIDNRKIWFRYKRTAAFQWLTASQFVGMDAVPDRGVLAGFTTADAITWTCTTAGLYLISGTVAMGAFATPTGVRLGIRITPFAPPSTPIEQTASGAPATAGTVSVSIMQPYRFAVGDRFTLTIISGSGSIPGITANEATTLNVASLF